MFRAEQTFDVPPSPHQQGELEVAMMGRLQQQVLTIMQPFIDHLDQMFTAVESLGEDLAEEQARSRVQHDATSLRFSNMDETMSARLADLVNDLQDQRNQGLLHVTEQKFEEQQCHLTALVSAFRQELDLNRELLPLLAESKAPLAKLFEQQEEVKHVMNRVEERLDKSVCDWQETVDTLRQEFHSSTESLNNGTRPIADTLQRDQHLHAERIACLDAQLQEILPSVDAMREAVGAVQPTLNKLAQAQFDAFGERLGIVEGETQSMKNFVMKIADTQAAAGALQLGFQQKTAVVQEVAVWLLETNSRITDKLEPALEEQQRRIAGLEARDMERVDGMKGRLTDGSAAMEVMRESVQTIKQAMSKVTSKVVASGGHPVGKPDQHGYGPDAVKLATNDVKKQSGKTDASHQPCRFQMGSVQKGLNSNPAVATGEVARRPHSSPRMQEVGSKTGFQGLAMR
mmetsp:Transcript_129236/g.251626  ORF Transcript_129236/g.251626 Transcript_129236/m.251626 type:complete len:458 (-) Transcript_129236:190-1563(-)